MHTRNRFGATMLSCAIALATGTAAAQEPTAFAGDCFVAGFGSGDADAVAACYAEDAVMWFPGGPMAKGRAAIRDGFAHFFADVTITDVQLTEMGQETMGDTKVAWGTYAIGMVDKATQVASVERGRYTDVQKKIDGRWLYTVDHPSDDPPPPPPPAK
jgi:uncharacterized protein (TIGR02246 family)